MGDFAIPSNAAFHQHAVTPEEVAEQPEQEEEPSPYTEISPSFDLDEVQDELSLSDEDIWDYIEIIFNVLDIYTNNNLGFIPTKTDLIRHIVKDIRNARGEGDPA